MAEFVQRHLEELLPVFTGLQRTEILTNDEVKILIQKVRQFEYSVNKRTKRPKDYLNYGEYLSDLLELVRIRRDSMKMKNKKGEIEKPLKLHAAHLYRICSERFKKAEYYEKEIEFLDNNKLFHILTKTYTRFLQFHGTNPLNHEKAARWEYFENKSAENARIIFQFALRKFPKDIGLWVAFFEMEIAYVVMLLERRARLAGVDDKTHVKNEILVSLEDISDAVFEFKLAEIVLNQGQNAVDNKNELLSKCLEVTHNYGELAEKMADTISKLLSPGSVENVSSEAAAAEISKEGAELSTEEIQQSSKEEAELSGEDEEESSEEATED